MGKKRRVFNIIGIIAGLLLGLASIAAADRANLWNPVTGVLVIREAVEGSLRRAVDSAVGGPEFYGNIREFIVTSSAAPGMSGYRLSNEDLSFVREERERLLLLERLDFSAAATVPGAILEEDYLRCHRGVREVLMPPGVEQVAPYAFDGCVQLGRVSLPGVKRVGYRAFYGCTALRSLLLPEALVLGDLALGGCTSLETVFLPEAGSIGYKAFEGCTALTALSLPRALEVGLHAFSGCVHLNRLALPRVRCIGDEAFDGCFSLEFLLLGETVPAVFSDTLPKSAVKPALLLPLGSRRAYESNANWKRFALPRISAVKDLCAEKIAPFSFNGRSVRMGETLELRFSAVRADGLGVDEPVFFEIGAEDPGVSFAVSRSPSGESVVCFTPLREGRSQVTAYILKGDGGVGANSFVLTVLPAVQDVSVSEPDSAVLVYDGGGKGDFYVPLPETAVEMDSVWLGERLLEPGRDYTRKNSELLLSRDVLEGLPGGLHTVSFRRGTEEVGRVCFNVVSGRSHGFSHHSGGCDAWGMGWLGLLLPFALCLYCRLDRCMKQS